MKIKFFAIIVFFTLLSCNNFSNHSHDGEYSASTIIGTVNWKVNGNEITIENSLLGVKKIKCKQYSDRIEYVDTNGVENIVYLMDNGDLKQSDLIVLKKIKSNNQDE